LLLIDDWGLDPITSARRNDLKEIMDDRHGQSFFMLISQLPNDQWYASIADNTLLTLFSICSCTTRTVSYSRVNRCVKYSGS
jgi:DNA replication protein DnaC